MMCFRLAFGKMFPLFSGLAHLLSPCRNLVHLNAGGVSVNRAVCEMIGRNAQLESLTLSNAQGLDAPGLTAVLKGCQKYFDF